MNQITKRDAKHLLGINTDADLARFFLNTNTGKPISRWAVGQWSDDEPLPMPRQWELRARRPTLFRKHRSKIHGEGG